MCGNIFKATNGLGEVQLEVMCDEVEIVKGFCNLGNLGNLGNRLNASGGCEAAMTAKTRMGWKKFKMCGEILFQKKDSLCR